MSKPTNILLPALLGALALCSCNGSGDSNVAYEPVKITRLDRAATGFPADSDSTSIEGLRLLVALNGGGEATTDSALRASIDSLSATAAYRMFGPEVARRFGSTDTIAAALGAMKALWSSGHFPDRVYTMISPYRQSVVTVDTTVLMIALNHYMGAGHEAYSSFPDYQRRLKSTAHLPYDIAEALTARDYPFGETSATTLLSRMAYAGAMTAIAMESIPDADLAEALGWSDEQLKVAEQSEKDCWRRLAEMELIYSDSPAVTAQMIGPAATANVISPTTPGGVGRYLGYRIVSSYLRSHPEVTATTFLAEKLYDSPTLLRDADYTF